MRKMLVIAALLTLVLPSAGDAHPRLFLTSQLRMIANAERDIAEIRNIWRFEPASSALILQEFDRNSNGSLEDDERSEIAIAVHGMASPFTIETYLVQNGRKVPLSRPRAVRVDVLGKTLVVNYSVKPKTPVRFEGRMALWAGDPHHNSVLDFWSDDDLKISDAASGRCERRVVRLDAVASSRNQTIATVMFFNDPHQSRMALTSTRMEIDCPR